VVAYGSPWTDRCAPRLDGDLAAVGPLRLVARRRGRPYRFRRDRRARDHGGLARCVHRRAEHDQSVALPDARLDGTRAFRVRHARGHKSSRGGSADRARRADTPDGLDSHGD